MLRGAGEWGAYYLIRVCRWLLERRALWRVLRTNESDRLQMLARYQHLERDWRDMLTG